MIYSIIGTSPHKRLQAQQELSRLGKVTNTLYGEHINEIKPLIDATSLFGDPIIVECVQMLEKADTKEHIYDLLPFMQASKTIFIIDEPFGDTHKKTKLAKVSTHTYDALEEKKTSTQVFTLAQYVAQRDKKNAWIHFLICKESEDAEAIQGALWWKHVQVWQKTLEGETTRFTKEDCERLGRMLLMAPIKAHKGEADLYNELEHFILSL